MTRSVVRRLSAAVAALALLTPVVAVEQTRAGLPTGCQHPRFAYWTEWWAILDSNQ
jgi:hypothetical protein